MSPVSYLQIAALRRELEDKNYDTPGKNSELQPRLARQRYMTIIGMGRLT